MTLQVFVHRVSQGNEQHSGSLASLYYVRSFCHKLHHSDVQTCDTRRLSCNDETEECEVRKIYQKRYCRESILETSTSVSSLVCFKVWKKIKYVQCLVDLSDGMHQYTLELFVPLICKFLCIKIFSKKKNHQNITWSKLTDSTTVTFVLTSRCPAGGGKDSTSPICTAYFS